MEGHAAWFGAEISHLTHHQTQDMSASSIASVIGSIFSSGVVCSVVSLVPKTWVLLASVFLRSETHSASYKIPSTFALLCNCSHETLRCGSFRAMHALTIA